MEYVIAAPVCALVVYFMYCTHANDRATTKITRSRLEIKSLLGAFHLHEIAHGDISPSEVQYSLISNANRGLPSRVALRYLKGIKDGHLTVEQLYSICLAIHNRHEAWLKKRRTL